MLNYIISVIIFNGLIYVLLLLTQDKLYRNRWIKKTGEPNIICCLIVAMAPILREIIVIFMIYGSFKENKYEL